MSRGCGGASVLALIGFVTIWFFFLLSTSQSQTLEPLPQDLTASNVGLFVGVNHYARSNYARLDYAVNDAVALADAFVFRLGFIPAQNAHLMIVGEPTGKNVERLRALRQAGARIVTEAGRNACKAAVQRVCQFATGTNGLILISFSGHGQEHAGNMYFVPPDGEPGMADSLVSLLDVKTNLDSRAELKRWLLVDACRLQLIPGKGAVQFPEVTREFRRAFAAASGRIVFASCDANQVSLEDGQSEQGVFTRSFLVGLDNPNSILDSPYVTIGDLIRHASSETFKRASQIASGNPNIPPASVQRPWFEARGESLATPVAISPYARAAFARREKRAKGAKLLVQDARIHSPTELSEATARSIEQAIDTWTGEEGERLLNKIESLLSRQTANDPEAFVAWWQKQTMATGSNFKGRTITADTGTLTPPPPASNPSRTNGRRVVIIGAIEGLAPKHEAEARSQLEEIFRHCDGVEVRVAGAEPPMPPDVSSDAISRFLTEQGGDVLVRARFARIQEAPRRGAFNGANFNNQVFTTRLTILIDKTGGDRPDSKSFPGQATFFDGQHVTDGTDAVVADTLERLANDEGFLRQTGLNCPKPTKK